MNFFQRDTDGQSKLSNLTNFMPKEVSIQFVEKPGMEISDDQVLHFQHSMDVHHFA